MIRNAVGDLDRIRLRRSDPARLWRDLQHASGVGGIAAFGSWIADRPTVEHT